MIIRGWQNIAKYLNCSVRTAKRWHYDVIKMPIFKPGNSANSHIFVRINDLDTWVSMVRKNKKGGK